MITILIVSVCVVIAYIVIFVIKYRQNEKNKVINQQIIANSQKIKDLIKLNEETSFYAVKNRFEINKHYDNKMNYNKIDPSYLMTADIRNHIDYYYDIIDKIKKNRVMYSEYINKVNDIRQNVTMFELDELNISQEECRTREDGFFISRVLSPVVNCHYVVNMSYSSPKGRVYLYKQGGWDLEDMFVCLESVSRSHLDKETYNKLAKVERGNVSDSLRYDILNRDGFRCVICGASANEGARLHVDHIVPIAKGGKSISSNLRTLCERCNIGKSDKLETKNYTEKNISKENSDSLNLNAIRPNSYESYQNTINENKNVCSRCGARLVKRIGKYGDFYGCSNYPKCTYTETR